MANTSFEAITSRQAWYAASALAKYDAVMIDTSGKYAKADGTRPFAGIVQYGADAADQMVTVVRGTFPGVASATIVAGDLLNVSAGKFAKVTPDAAGVQVIGVALTGGAADELIAVSMLETGFIAKS